jgi:tetratricopeptide (TPR) repeat protein
MARKRYGKTVAKVVIGVVLLIIAAIGLSYGSMLRQMDQAADDYAKGDLEGALKRYESVEAKLRSAGVIRIVPANDRRNLFLNEARLLYAMGKYDEALEHMERENEISGTTSDGRYLLLRGQVAFRKAIDAYRDPKSKKDPAVLEEALHAAEDNMKDSLRLAPNDWDGKYDYEFVNYIRNLMNQEDKGKMKVLMENVRVKEIKPKALTAEQSM